MDMVDHSGRLRLVDDADATVPPASPGAAPDFDQLFRTYAPYVANIGLRLLGRQGEVDDLVQDVFLAAHRGMKRLRDGAAVKGWLATVAVRTAGRRLRARRMRAMLGLHGDAAEYFQVAAAGTNPERRALLARIYRVLDEIPVKERVAWTLRHVEGEPLERVATLCGCSLATAKRRIAAAHGKIREVVCDG